MTNETKDGYDLEGTLQRLNSFLKDENIELVAKIEIRPAEDKVRNIYDEQAKVEDKENA